VIIERLKQVDIELFLLLYQLRHPYLTPFFEWVTNKWVWAPLYLYLFFALYRNLGLRKTMAHFLIIVLLIFLSDNLASAVCKPYFGRLRPCNEPLLTGKFSMEGRPCSSSFSFVSSHAANSFALSLYLTFIFRALRLSSGWFCLIWGWSFLHTYSRLYLGLHYPLDLISGAFIGIAAAYILYFLSIYIFHFWEKT
jgi:undecaprenyl-diphosphatase